MKSELQNSFLAPALCAGFADGPKHNRAESSPNGEAGGWMMAAARGGL
jgi:hypothetical protein